MQIKQESQSSPTAPGTRGDRAIAWIEKHCVIPEGKDVGQPVKLREWQRVEIRKIYNNPAGTRRAIISFGRKNAKTTLSAFLLLLHLCGPEAKVNSQLLSSATSQEQAAVVFELAAKMVRMSPTLREFVSIRDTVKELLCKEIGTIYKALSAEKKTAFGKSPIFLIHDELAQVKGPRSELYEALETAVGAHENPLSIIISTQAPTDGDLLSILIDDALAGHDPRVVVSLYTAPMEAEPFARETIALANPALGDFLNEDEVLAMAADAHRMPSREPEYRNFVLNQRVEASSPFVSRGLWQSCGAVPKSLEGVPLYCGLDLSSVNDLTALIIVGKVDGVWQVHSTFWLPGDGLADKARADRVPYDMWAKDGHLIAAPGKSIDYEYVASHLAELLQTHDIRRVAFDRWGFKHLKPCLLDEGMTEQLIEQKFEEFGQGYQSMSPALRALEGEILNGRIAHGNHPVLSMCAANAVVQMDPAGNRKLNKARSSGRIDGMVALVMAVGTAVTEVVEPPRDFKLMFI